MYLRKRNGKWSFTINTKDEYGKRKQITRSGFETKEEAEIKAIELQNDIREGMNPNTAKVRHIIDLWLNEKQSNVRDSTFYTHNNIVKNHILPLIGEMKIQDVKVYIIDQYIQSLLSNGHKKSYVKLVLTDFRSILDKAVSLEFVRKNVARNVKTPQNRKVKQQIWTIEETNRFLEYAKIYSSNHYISYYIAVYTGLRLGEVLALRWSDLIGTSIHVSRTITLRNGKYVFGEPKTEASKRIVPMPHTLWNELMDLKTKENPKNDDLIVKTRTGNLVYPYILRKQMQKMCGYLDLSQITFHTLRKIHTTILMDAGVNAKVIQERLGHTNISTTFDIYTYTYNDKHDEAADHFDNALKSGHKRGH